MSISPRTLALLCREVDNINRYLAEYDPPLNGEERLASLGETAEFIIVQNMPLPDAYEPDYCDLLLIVSDFPATPPIGLYVLNENEALIAQLRRRFNAFRDTSFHEAPALQGYTWICYSYCNNSWKYRAAEPMRGDNLRKFLASFFAGC